MNGNRNHHEPRPTPAELTAWADGELAPADARRVERWLAQHPDAAHEGEALPGVARLYREHPPADPGAAVWQVVLGRIEARLAGPAQRPPAPWRLRLFAGLVAAAAALLGGVLLARTFWPEREIEPGGVVERSEPSGRAEAEDEEPFAVATASEVHIIGMDPQDADRVVVGVPLMGSIEFVGTEEVEIVHVDPDAEGGMPRVRRSVGGPMWIAARAEGDEP